MQYPRICSNLPGLVVLFACVLWLQVGQAKYSNVTANRSTVKAAFHLVSITFPFISVSLFFSYSSFISSFLSLLFLFPSNLYFPHTFSQQSFVLSPFLRSLNSLLHPYSPPFLFFLSTYLSNLLNLLPSSRQNVSASSFVHFFVRFLLFVYHRPSIFSFVLCLPFFLLILSVIRSLF